jgi:plasmid stabilization system protein ParE
MKYEFLTLARAELEATFDFYEDRRPGLGDEFTAEVESTVAKILQHPTLWTRLSGNVRRCRLSRFPYALIYQIRRDLILIVAVAHLRRDPNYWKGRLIAKESP